MGVGIYKVLTRADATCVCKLWSVVYNNNNKNNNNNNNNNSHKQENKKYLPNRHSYSKYAQSRQNNNRKTKEIARTGERNTCYVEAGCSTSGPDSNFSYGNNSKVTVTKRLNLHPNTYTNAKSGNSWHMFNCKKFPKLHIRPRSLILLMIHPRIGEYFPAKAEK
jgi:hypothetical protein